MSVLPFITNGQRNPSSVGGSNYYYMYIPDFNTIVTSYGRKVKHFSLREGRLLDEFLITDTLFKDVLYMDDSLFINRNAVYRHDHFKSFDRLCDINMPWPLVELGKPPYYFEASDLCKYDPFSQSFIAVQPKTNVIFQVDVKTGFSETKKITLPKRMNIHYPLSSRYLYMITETKGIEERYFFDIQTQELIKTDFGRNIYRDDIFPISDSTYIMRNSIHHFRDSSYNIQINNPVQLNYNFFGNMKLVSNGWFLVCVESTSFIIYDMDKRLLRTHYSKGCDNCGASTMRALKQYTGSIRDIAISPDGKYVVISFYEHGMVRFELDTWIEVNKYPFSTER